jgi:hypothetical protein
MNLPGGLRIRHISTMDIMFGPIVYEDYSNNLPKLTDRSEVDWTIINNVRQMHAMFGY